MQHIVQHWILLQASSNRYAKGTTYLSSTLPSRPSKRRLCKNDSLLNNWGKMCTCVCAHFTRLINRYCFQIKDVHPLQFADNSLRFKTWLETWYEDLDKNLRQVVFPNALVCIHCLSHDESIWIHMMTALLMHVCILTIMCVHLTCSNNILYRMLMKCGIYSGHLEFSWLEQIKCCPKYNDPWPLPIVSN